MPRKRKPRAESYGGYGYTVEIRERVPGGPIYLRSRGVWKSLKHRDWTAAEKKAKELAAELLATDEAVRAGARPLHLIFARYQAEVSVHKKGAQPAEDERRIALWESFVFGSASRAVPGHDYDARYISEGDLKRFERERRAGRIRVPDRVVTLSDGQEKRVPRKLAARPSDTTIGADIVFLLAVLNWATTVYEGEAKLLDANPVAGYQPPRSPAPKRPVATRERFLRVYRHTHRVDAQGMFRHFFALIGDEIDWRVTALCNLKVSDIDLQPRPELGTPFGRIRKNEHVDKEGAGGWIPLSPRGRLILQRALRQRRAIGDVYLFESPKKKGKPWSRWHARDLLERAEAAAEILPIDGGDFHPYRRLWSTRRKDLPWVDIAAVTGRKDRRTFERSYTAADPDTMLRVVMAGREKQSAKAKESVAEVVARQG